MWAEIVHTFGRISGSAFSRMVTLGGNRSVHRMSHLTTSAHVVPNQTKVFAVCREASVPEVTLVVAGGVLFAFMLLVIETGSWYLTLQCVHHVFVVPFQGWGNRRYNVLHTYLQNCLVSCMSDTSGQVALREG